MILISQNRRVSAMANDKEVVSGGCLCGKIRYECSAPAKASGFCHCTTCQRALGSAFGVWSAFGVDDVEITKGQIKWYRSSDIARRGFCGDCGSPIAYVADGSDTYYLWVGSLDKRDDLELVGHWNAQSRLPWDDMQMDIPSYSEIFDDRG